MKDNSVIAIIGKVGSGKSTLAKKLLQQHNDNTNGMVISNDGDCHNYSEARQEYDSEIVKNFIEKQGSSSEKGYFVMDDCLYLYKNPWNDENIMKLFLYGRRYNMMSIFISQSPLDIPLHLRNNIDYVFIFNDKNYNSREKTYELYAKLFPTFDSFSTVMDTCCDKDYDCMVINNNVTSNKLEDRLFWYRVENNE